MAPPESASAIAAGLCARRVVGEGALGEGQGERAHREPEAVELGCSVALGGSAEEAVGRGAVVLGPQMQYAL